MAYDKKNDVVWICPNNTKGEIITIQNLRIGLPKQPLKKTMLFYNKKKKEQRARRPGKPKLMYGRHGSQENPRGSSILSRLSP